MSAEPVATNLDYADPDVRILHGDALQRLGELPSESVQCIITSPPFWGLRDYGTGTWSGGDPACGHAVRRDPRTESSTLGGGKKQTGHQQEGYGSTCGRCGAIRIDQQIGLEETPDEWCDRLVAVFRECRRVLRDDGTLWLEIGDKYADKGLVGAPWLLAFALRADGWFLRSDCIWARPNPMPESVTDRPTKAHSYVFLLTKRGRYYYDADAIREGGPQVYRSKAPDGWDTGDGAHGAIHRNGREAGKPAMIESAGANARSVWSIATEPTPFAHFATFPQSLVEKCLKAGTKEGDVVLDPFMGSGTVGIVARRLGRHAVGVELNAEYIAIAARRLAQQSLLA